MQIGVGYELIYEFPQPTPLLLTVHIHYSRASDLVAADHLVTASGPAVLAAGLLRQQPTETGDVELGTETTLLTPDADGRAPA